jgi:hypothetical protein
VCYQNVVHGVCQTLRRVCIRPCTECVSSLVLVCISDLVWGSIRPGAGCVSGLVQGVYIGPDTGGVSDLVQGVYQTLRRVCIRPCTECVPNRVLVCTVCMSDLVSGEHQTWCRVCIRPGAGCVSDLAQGAYQTWCMVCIRPGAWYVSCGSFASVQKTLRTVCFGPGARSDLVSVRIVVPRICVIRPCAGCISVHCVRYVSNLVQENYKNLSMMRIMPGAGWLSVMVRGKYPKRCRVCNCASKPGAGHVINRYRLCVRPGMQVWGVHWT